MAPHAPIPIIDIFAGPGGLGEGFGAVRRRGGPAFRIALSIEKDPHAHSTLALRAFFRQFTNRRVPETYYEHLRGKLLREKLYERHPAEAQAALDEAWCAELGGVATPEGIVRRRIHHALHGSANWVLIGGPPCQAYSLVGRSRNRGIKGYALERDDRHRLYEQYLKIVAEHSPPIFVMENVRGLLSTTVRDELLFERIYEDLRDPCRALQTPRRPRYEIFALDCEDRRNESQNGSLARFVVRSEHHGVPQARHRVILLGVREDLGCVAPPPLRTQPPISVGEVLYGLPRLRSGLSRTEMSFSQHADDPQTWLDVLRAAANQRWVMGNARMPHREAVCAMIQSTIHELRIPRCGRGGEFVPGNITVRYEPQWYLDDRIGGACNHATRGHMDRDLHRYLFAACFAKVNGCSPRLRNFPPDLLPNHRNVSEALNGRLFNDRFRVQVKGAPATTITSHISKDGHYYIHYDPLQCRSLTVREAARLQTFPDNYLFTGPRTMQYVQVGNAVPPLLARQIAGIVHAVLERAGMTD